MKRLFISFLLLTVMLCGAMAQPIYVYRKDAPKETFQRSNVESIRYSKEDMDGVTHPNYVVQEFCTSEGITRIPLSAIDSVVYMPYSPSYLTCPDDHHPHAIDLGLPSGTKWACCNVGAASPEEYGGHYAWGETSEKELYTQANYAYYNPSTKEWTSIGDDIAGTSYDVAHVQWGGSWLMPSHDRQMELINNCNREWSTVNGVNGTLVTGPSGGQIFLPAAGFRWSDNLDYAGSYGSYWSSTQDPDDTFNAYDLYFYSYYWGWGDSDRYRGMSVRAVCPDSPVAEHPEAHSSITDFNVTASAYAADGFTYEGKTYNYKFDVSVSAEIDNLEGVEDWGYVYQTPDGSITRVSLMEYGQSYTDTRYAYYRNEAHSAVSLYAYVKYVGDSQYHDGTPQDYPLDYTAPTVHFSCPDAHHPHAIDLGLPSGTKWACCNIGATAPEEYGGYYAWGETSEKSYYLWDTYAYYNTSTGEYISLGSEIAGTSYDVAHVKWGGLWIMPTHDMQMELVEHCSREWTTVNGINGVLITGPSGGQIFLPAAGFRWYDEIGGAGSGSYLWSSTQDPDYESDSAYGMDFHSDGLDWSYDYPRRHGMSVRAVCPGSPVAEHPEAHPLITDFKVTASAYAADGFTYEGQTYDYKFDVSVTAEIDNLEGVEDWGYVYQTPDGSITRVSLMEYGQSYTDTRYAYYRNEAHSTVSLYAYVQYVGDSQYYDCEPQDYPLDYTAPTARFSCPDDHHPHAIDLGLPSGTKWACCNIGATTPEGYGGYYAWGETSEKDYYDEETYVHYDWSTYKYINIGSDISGTSYDVAHVRWGGSWVMPSLKNLKELLNNCSREWTSLNGVDGTLVTGPSGGQIFLPAAGARWDDGTYRVGTNGDYWLSTSYREEGITAGSGYSFDFESDNWEWDGDGGTGGESVRAVCPASYVVGPPEAHPLIKDFKVTASAYTASGFTYEGQTYDYKFDVSVSAEIDNLEGVEDWGYVYQTPDGSITRVSLIKYSLSFTDTRYAYYRNEAHSTVSLYAYVKYVGDSQYYDGELQEYSLDYTAPTSYLTCPDDHHPHAIDLGLPSGTKWACCNVGADAPEEYGGYYAWGETSEKDSYTQANYAYYNSSMKEWTSIGDDIAGTSYDVAHVQWGSSWVMPSHDRQMELINNCNRELSTVNGVSGTLITGPSGGQIFLPAAGYRWSGNLNDAGFYGYYWSSTQNPDYSNRAYCLYFNSNGWYWLYYSRYDGQSVRAVCP